MEPESHGEIELKGQFGVVGLESIIILEIIMYARFGIQADALAKIVLCANGRHGRE